MRFAYFSWLVTAAQGLRCYVEPFLAVVSAGTMTLCPILVVTVCCSFESLHDSDIALATMPCLRHQRKPRVAGESQAYLS